MEDLQLNPSHITFRTFSTMMESDMTATTTRPHYYMNNSTSDYQVCNNLMKGCNCNSDA